MLRYVNDLLVPHGKFIDYDTFLYDTKFYTLIPTMAEHKWSKDKARKSQLISVQKPYVSLNIMYQLGCGIT